MLLKRTGRRALIAVALGWLIAAAPVSAAPVLTFNEATGGSGVQQNQSVGWQFDVLAPVLVTGLGWFDQGANGLSVGHTVGIWGPTGTLLTSALVPSGTSASLDGQFRTVSVAPLLLAPGTGYIVGGQNFSTSTDRLAFDVSFVLNPALSFVDATFSDFGGFMRPTNFSAAVSGFFGPSFSVGQLETVPEPVGLLLLGSGLVLLAARRRRKA